MRTGRALALLTVAWATACADGGTEPTASGRPWASGTIPVRTVAAGETIRMSVAPFFGDPDGDVLMFAASSSDPALVGANVSGGTVTLRGVSQGLATITLTARDPGGLMASGTFAVTVQAAGAANVCDRTPQVRDEIVRVTGAASCGAVTDSALAAIPSLDLRVGGTSGDTITALRDGDFAGLSSLKVLDLSYNRLSSPPDSVFAGLSGLEDLDLSDNQLESLPEGVFAGLSSLEDLDLSSNQLTTLPDTVFVGLSSLGKLELWDNRLSSLPEGVFAGLSSLEDLDLSANRLSSLPEGVFAGLSSLEDLGLGSNQLSSLPEGVFAGLSSLEDLWLSWNRLSSLPAGVFAGLSSLDGLRLWRNRLSSLPEGVFAGLSSLKNLRLGENRLSSLPEGVFAGLSSLEDLGLGGNPGAPFELALGFERTDGAAAVAPPASVRLTLAEGAPFAMTVSLTVAGGSASPSTASLPAGNTEGRVFIVTQAAPGQPARLTAANLSAIPDGFTGIELAAPAELVMFGGGTGSGVCDRTPQVRDEIVRVTGAASCGAVTDSALAGIRELNLNASAIGDTITALRAGDFAGLSSLELLGLGQNRLSSLPEDVFNGLSSLEDLGLGGNQLSSLPEEVFDGLSSLEDLGLGPNRLSSLPEGVFAGLSNLESLDLGGNPGAPFELALGFERTDGAARAAPPASVRLTLAEGAPFVMTVPLTVEGGTASPSTASLTAGSVGGAVFTVIRAAADQPARVTASSLPAIPDRFTGIELAAPAELVLFGGGIGVCDRTPQVRDEIVRATGATHCGAVTDSALAAITVLDLSIPQASAALAQAQDRRRALVAGIRAVERRSLDRATAKGSGAGAAGDTITSLRTGDFAGLSGLKELWLLGNQLSSLPAGVFAGLANLEDLDLGGNRLSSLPESLFAGLSSLEELWLDGNRLPSLPTGVFAGLSGLEVLVLSGNQLSGAIPPELGDLANMTGLYLHENQLTGTIPPALGRLAKLARLYLQDNRLSGAIPVELARLYRLRSLQVAGNDLCVPRSDSSFVAWLEGLTSHDTEDLPSCASTADDRDILVAFYNATGGLNWTNNTNWLSDAPLNEWHGVTANASERVTGLRFVGNNLEGSLPRELGRLSELDSLGIYNDEGLRGAIPAELGNLAKLDFLSLTRNGLSGPIPPELGQLTELSVLALGGNELTGSIPLRIADLRGLTELYLWGNQLTGTIPGELGRLTQLRFLELADNGTVSSGMAARAVADAASDALGDGAFPALGNIVAESRTGRVGRRTAESRATGLTGEIPPELGGLASLERLHLDRNNLTGAIPPELGDLASLTRLDLADNQLTGSIPPELGGLASLERLYLLRTNLSGPLPLSLARLTSLQTFWYGATDLCVPSNAAFRVWLASLQDHQGTGVDCVSGAPDLLVSSVDPTEITLVAGGAADTVAFTILNAGDGAADSTTATIRVSGDSTITTGDTAIGDTIAVSGLAASDSTEVGIILNVAAGTQTGVAYVGMCVEPVSGESDIGNNCSSAVAVTIVSAAAADFEGAMAVPVTRIYTVKQVVTVGPDRRDDNGTGTRRPTLPDSAKPRAASGEALASPPKTTS